MKTIASFCFVTVLASAVVSTAFAKIERVVNRKFDVQPGGSLSIDSYTGSIKVQPGDAATVTVEVKQSIVADSDKEADELLQSLTLDFQHNGSAVAVKARYDGPRAGGWFFSGGPAVRVDYVVSVPSRFDVDLKTRGGSLTVGDLTGKIVADTAGGSLSFGDINGELSGRTAGGSISLESCTGKTRLATSGGSLKLGKIGGTADVSTSGGSISVEEASGALQAHTSGGSINVRLTGPIESDCDISTSGGSISVAVDPQSAFKLDASTSGGSVKAELPGLQNGSTARTHVTGQVGGGGPLLKVHTSGGSVRVSTT
jgi:hypothetical protein